MHSETIDNQREMAKARHAYEHDARSRGLKRNWFTALIALWLLIFAFIPAMGLMPQPVWAGILGLLVVIAFAIAIFGPRNRDSARS